MSPDSTSDPHATAIRQLKHMGLSTYAARTFVALTGLGRATAKEVSEVVDVPRTKVYDAVEELHDLGLVDVQQSSPKRFWAVSVESTGRKFRNDLQRRADLLTGALADVGLTNVHDEQRGVWTADGREAITDRVVEFVDGAEEEAVYTSVESVLDERVLEALAAASERGVAVKLVGSPPAVAERVRTAVPEASMVESAWPWADTLAGRLLMVDGTQTLVSVLGEHADGDGVAARETAIWGVGGTNSLVVVLQAMFGGRFPEGTTDDGAVSPSDE